MEFNRIIKLLRKERGIPQKRAAEDLGISQALLSHYEKGIRECGLDFVVRCADYYDVSCDYLLGRSPDRSGAVISAEDIPDPNGMKDNVYRGSVLPAMNKKLIANSLNILYSKLEQAGNKPLVAEVSAYLMLAVYKMFRELYSSETKNEQSMFRTNSNIWRPCTDASMKQAETNVQALLSGSQEQSGDAVDVSAFAMTTESLSSEYPLYASSLMNLVKTGEARNKKLLCGE